VVIEPGLPEPYRPSSSPTLVFTFILTVLSFFVYEGAFFANGLATGHSFLSSFFSQAAPFFFSFGAPRSGQFAGNFYRQSGHVLVFSLSWPVLSVPLFSSRRRSLWAIPRVTVFPFSGGRCIRFSLPPYFSRSRDPPACGRIFSEEHGDFCPRLHRERPTALYVFS